MAGHAQLKFVMTESSKTQIRGPDVAASSKFIQVYSSLQTGEALRPHDFP